jgi:hypothetical protein
MCFIFRLIISIPQSNENEVKTQINSQIKL